MTYEEDYDWDFTIEPGMGPSQWDRHADEAGVVNPFEDYDGDIFDLTGSDWYKLALAASTGGKVVTGANLVSATETLSKIDEGFAKNHMHGRVHFDGGLVKVGDQMDGSDFRYAPYNGSDFKGTTSFSKTAMVFDTSGWEPSAKTRAKETAVFAAQVFETTGNMKEAQAAATAISGCPVPETVLAGVSVPLSRIKRDLIGVNKPNHTLFTGSTLQRAIVWTDSNMDTGKLPTNAAVDWARITTIARYLGEANIRYDPMFRDYAKSLGVPYTLISGCWAEVNISDYAFPEGVWNDVPSFDMTAYGVVSVEDAYDGQVDRLHAQLNRMLSIGVGDRVEVDVEAILAALDSFKERHKGKLRRVATGNDQIAEISKHVFDAQSAAQAVSSSGNADKVFKQVAYSYLAGDKVAIKWATNVVVSISLPGGNMDVESRNNLTRSYWKTPVLEAAKHELVSLVGAIGYTRMESHLRHLVNCSTATGGHLSASMLDNIGGTTTAIAHMLTAKKPPFVTKLIAPGSLRANIGKSRLTAALSYMANHLTRYRLAWKERYEDKARMFGSHGSSEAKRFSILYAHAAKAFDLITTTEVLASADGYINTANLSGCYLVVIAESYCRKRRMDPIQASTLTPAPAWEVAKQLDDLLDPSIPFVEAEEWVRPKLKMFSEDIINCVEPDLTTLESEVVELTPKTDSSANVAVFGFGPAGGFGVMEGMDDLDWDLPPEPPLIEKVRNSYPQGADPDAFAVANGYESFEAAFAALQAGARFDEYTNYTARGIAQTMAAAPAEVDETMF